MEVDRALMITVGAGSALMFVASLVALPMFVARAPRDFFTRDIVPHRSVVVRVGRNLLAFALIAAGIAMLVLPGQGLLTLLLGLCLADVPGKRALVRRGLRHEGIWKALDGLRRKLGKEPFERP